MKLTKTKIKDKIKELKDELYYPVSNGVRKVRPLDLTDKIILLESINTLRNKLKL